MHNAVMYMLSLYEVIGITRHLYIKLKSFSNIAQPLHKEAVCHCSFSLIIAKKSVIMSEAFLVDVSIHFFIFRYYTFRLKTCQFSACWGQSEVDRLWYSEGPSAG